MSKLRESARGQSCTFNLPNQCSYNPETVVLCHLKFEGGAMGKKPDDLSAAFGCSQCHAAIDGREKYYWGYRGEKDWYMVRAILRTWKVWREMGLLKA